MELSSFFSILFVFFFFSRAKTPLKDAVVLFWKPLIAKDAASRTTSVPRTCSLPREGFLDFTGFSVKKELKSLAFGVSQKPTGAR